MINQRKLLLILIFGIGTGLLLIAALLLNNADQPNSQPDDIVHESPISRAPAEQGPVEDLEILSIAPDDPERVFLPIVHIEFTFNEPVAASGLRFTTEPLTETNVFIEGNTAIIAPAGTWPPGNVTVTVLPDTSSVSGNRLSLPVSYDFYSNYDTGGAEGEIYDEE